MNTNSVGKNKLTKDSLQTQELENVIISRGVVGVSALIYSLIVGLYIVFVIFGNSSFYYGYENTERLPSAVFVDRRYNFFWFLYLFQFLRIFVYFLYIWSADWNPYAINYSFWVYTVHKTLTRIYIFLDILFILIILFLGWVNNSSWFPDNPCNDKNYCAAFGNLWDTLCKTELYTALNPNLLYSNISCTYDFWFSIVFLIFDIVMYMNSKSFHLSIIRYYKFNQ